MMRVDREDLLVLGQHYRKHAHAIADELEECSRCNCGLPAGTDTRSIKLAGKPFVFSRRIEPYSRVKDHLLLAAIAILRALPRPRRGRPRKNSTDMALELAEAFSGRAAARQAARQTGEDFEDIRSRMRAAKRKPKRKPKLR